MIGSGVIRQNVALGKGSTRSKKIAAGLVRTKGFTRRNFQTGNFTTPRIASNHAPAHTRVQMAVYETLFIVWGRCMIYMVGNSWWVMLATVISGIMEFLQRSSMMALDEFVRRRILQSKEIDKATKARQIEIWRYDICFQQLTELSTIPILGFMPRLMGAHCKYFVLSAPMNEVTGAPGREGPTLIL